LLQYSGFMRKVPIKIYEILKGAYVKNLWLLRIITKIKSNINNITINKLFLSEYDENSFVKLWNI
jgi:hypothetical protein